MMGVNDTWQNDENWMIHMKTTTIHFLNPRLHIVIQASCYIIVVCGILRDQIRSIDRHAPRSLFLDEEELEGDCQYIVITRAHTHKYYVT